MISLTLEKEIFGLTEDNINQLLQYAKFLKLNNQNEGHYSVSVKKNSDGNHKRKIGALADDFVSVSSDFDDTLEGLEEYI